MGRIEERKKELFSEKDNVKQVEKSNNVGSVSRIDARKKELGIVPSEPVSKEIKIEKDYTSPFEIISKSFGEITDSLKTNETISNAKTAIKNKANEISESAKTRIAKERELAEYMRPEEDEGFKSLEEIDAQIARLKSENAELEKKYPAGYFGDYDAAFKKENEAYARGIAQTLSEAPYEKQAGHKPDTTGYSNIGAQESFNQLEKSVAEQKKTNAEQIKALGYEKTKYNSDFEEKSKYKPIPKGEEIFTENKVNGGKYYVHSGYGEYTEKKESMQTEENRYEYINGNEDARKIMNLYFQMNATTLTGQTWGYLRQMNEDEIKIYNYLYSKNKKEAGEYIETLTPTLLKRERYERELEAKEEAKKHPIKESIGTVVTSPFKGFAFIGQTFDRMEGKELDANASYNRLIHTTNATRGQVSSDIEINLGGAWGKVGSFAYQTGMSMADSGIAFVASGGNPTISAGIMSAGATAITTVDALDRGLTTEQAYSLGVIAGFAELVSEKIGFDTLLDVSALKKGAGGYILKNMFAEGGEEGASSLVNTFADILISQDKSEWSKMVAEYMKEGHSESEAFGIAFAKQAANLGIDVLGGMLSGAGMSGGPAAVSTIANAKSAAVGKEYSSVTDAVINQGLMADENSEARKMAEELQKKLTSGEKITNAELGRAVRANEQATGKAFEALEAGVELEGMPRVKIPESINTAQSNAPTVASTPTASATPTETAADATTGAKKSLESIVKNTAPITPGFIRNEYSKNIGNKTIRALDAIAKRIGVEIEIGAPTGEFGDNGVYNNGRIAIAADANVLKAVLSHEVTHHMQRTAPAEYNAFVEMAIEASQKLREEEKAKIIELYRQEYANGSETFTDQNAIDEITADYASRLVDDVSLFRELANSNRNVAQRVVDAVRDFLKKISTVFSKNAADKAALEKYGTDVEGLKKVVAQWESMLATTEEAVAGGNINTADVYAGGETKYDVKKTSARITAEMSDIERTKIISEKNITAPIYGGEAKVAIENNSKDLNSGKIGLVKKAIATIGEQFGIFENDIKIKDVDVDVRLSKSNLKESVSKKATPTQLAKLLPVLEEAVGDAIGIERHNNRYYYDSDTVYFENLLGGYVDGENFVPVRFGLKHSKSGGDTLYVVVDQNKIPLSELNKTKKTEVVKATSPQSAEQKTSRSVNYKIPQIIPFVKSKDLLRYIPDNMLTSEQKTAKWEAVAETIKATNDKNDGIGNDYVTFSSEQFKNKDNTNPTSNPDIRYSKKTGDLLSKDYKPREASYLEETGLVEEGSEERSYIDDTGLLEETKQPEKKPKGKSYIDETGILETTEQAPKTETDVAKVARKIIKDYGSKEEFAKVNDALADLYAYMPSGDKGEVQRRARAIAKTMLENASVVDDTVYKENKEMRDYFRNTPISIDSRYGSDIQGYDSLNEFRKANMGRINLKNDGAPIDTLWGEIASKFPEYFSADETLHPADMLSQVEAALDAIQPIEYNPYSEYMGEATDALADDIIDRLMSIRDAEYKRGDMRGRRSYLEETGITETTDVRLKKLREKQRERVKKIYKGQRETVLRNKITRVTKNLDKLLRKPTDKNHVLQELQKPVANLLKAINLEGMSLEYGTDAMYHRVKADSPFAEATQRTEAFRELKKIYEKIGSEDGTITFAPELLEGDAEGRGKLFEKVIEMKDIPLYEMSEEQLRTVWNAVRAVENSVRTANKLFTSKRGQTLEGITTEMRDGAKMKGTRVEIKGLSKLQKLVGLDMMTPEEFFHRFGKGGDAIFRMLRDAQDKKTLLIERAMNFASKLVSDEKISKLEKTTHKVTLGGETVEMSTAQLMELYVLTRRKQATEHIFKGGIQPEALPGIKSVVRQSVIRRVTQAEIGKALDNLTPEQKKIAEKLSRFASSVLGAEMNEASLKVFGYEKFGEENYWPIRTVETALKTDEKQAGGKKVPPSIRNYGMASATTPGAKTPLKIGSIFDTFTSHTAEATTYAAYLEATEDLRRIINYTFADEGGGVADTMKEVVEKTFGKDGLQYWMNLDEDISGGMKGDGDGFFDTLLKNTKAARIAGNIRVILQQPTAVLRAGSMIDYKYLLEGMSHVVRGWKRAVKYSPIAKWKSYGFFDSNTGPRMKDLLFDQSSALEKVREFGMKGTELADSFGWGVLWSACEKELEAKIKKGSVDMKVGTEDFYNAVAKRFTEIVDHTQVVDGVLQRSQIMRSSNAIDKMATSFMAEPTKTLNMFMSAVRDFAQAEKGEARTEAGKKLARTTMSLLISFTINAALGQSLVDALRDDDKEEEYWKRWLENFGENMVDSVNPFQYFPYLKDLWSVAEGFSVNRMDMDGVENIIEAAKELVASFKDESKLSTWGTINNMCAVVGTMFGVGTANVKRDVRAAAREFAAATDNYVLEYYMAKVNYSIKYEKNKGDFYDILRRAYENDKKAYRIIRKDMLKNGFTEEDIEKKMKTETLSGDFKDALAEARDAKDSKEATDVDKIVYKHLNREGNAERGTTAADKNTVVKNLPEYRELVEKYLDKYPGEDADKRVDYAYREANREMYGAEYALRVNGGKDVHEKAKAKVDKGKMTWDEYYEEYFGKTERRYAKLSKRYDLTYAEFEKVQIAISKNSEKKDEIKAIQEALGVGYARAKKIREIYYDVK